jgi:hypothetical protein
MSVYFPQAVMILRVLWEDFGQGGSASKVFKLPVLARRLSVSINDYNSADTFDAEIDFKSFPFDPRCIRSCGVSIHVADMGSLYKDGQLNQIDLEDESSLKNSVIFQGFVDEESIELDDERRTVKLEGRDFTSLFLDAKYLEGKPIATTTPLDTLLEQLIGQVPGASAITLEDRTGKTLPTLAEFSQDFGALGASKNAGKDDNYWEIIQSLVAQAGLICFIEIDKLVLATPRTLYDKKNAKQFIYGKNVKTLQFKRKLGRHKGFNVKVRYMDLATKKVLTAEIPREADADWLKANGLKAEQVTIASVDPKTGEKTEKPGPVLTFRVANVKNQKQLTEIGQKIFEEMSRQQIEGELVTHDMETMDKKENAFDLTKLRVGLPIEIELDQDDLAEISRMKSQDARVKFLKARGYESDVAAALAKSMGAFSPVFFTKAATFTVDHEQGFQLKIDFLNFIDLDNKGISFG